MSYLLLFSLLERLSMASTVFLGPFPRSVRIVSDHVQFGNACDVMTLSMREVMRESRRT